MIILINIYTMHFDNICQQKKSFCT